MLHSKISLLATVFVILFLLLLWEYIYQRDFDFEIYILLGPIILMADVSPANRISGTILSVVLLGIMATLSIRRNCLFISVAVFSGLTWILIGLVALGINA